MDTQQEKLITQKQASEMLGVSVETIRRWRALGTLVPIYISGSPKPKFKLTEILALMQRKNENV